VHLRRGVDDLVDRQEGEVEGHELDDWSEACHRRTDTQSGEAEFADGRVYNPLIPELSQQAFRDLIGAVVLGDLFADQEDVGVAFHLFTESLVEGLAVGNDGH